MNRYSVVIVEDHMLFSQAIEGVIANFERFKFSYSCKNGLELIEKFSNKKNIPNLVLMDINMPIMNGIETTKWIKENHPEVNVLALTVEENESTILQMIRAGAKGYLLKDVDKKTLENALLKIMETGYYHTKKVNDIIIHSLSGERNYEIQLKEEETKLLRLVCTELTYKEIADIMGLTPKTIDGYRVNLFTKLHVKNRVGLVLYAIKNKLFYI